MQAKHPSAEKRQRVPTANWIVTPQREFFLPSSQSLPWDSPASAEIHEEAKFKLFLFAQPFLNPDKSHANNIPEVRLLDVQLITDSHANENLADTLIRIQCAILEIIKKKDRLNLK